MGIDSVFRVFVTDGKGLDHLIVPKKDLLFDNGIWWGYKLPLQNARLDPTSIEFDLPLSNGGSDYCFEEGTEYSLWMIEDMYDMSENDNLGTAYTDIYICPTD